MARLTAGILEEPRKLGSHGTLVGVVTRPAERNETRPPVFVFLNSGLLHRVGASRMNVWLARALAAEGVVSVRFDLSGLGDSDATDARLGFVDRSVREIREVMDELEMEGAGSSFVPVGLCSGADLAYEVGLRDPRVSGVVAIDGHAFRTTRFWWHHYRDRLLRAESWWNVLRGRTLLAERLGMRDPDEAPRPVPEEAPSQRSTTMVEVFRRRMPSRDEVAAGYRAMVARDVRLLQIFTGGLEESYNYRNQFRDAFHDVDFRDRLTLEFLPEADHTFTRLESQVSLLRTVRRWTLRLVCGAGREGAGAGSRR